jgi:hypothetical protein
MNADKRRSKLASLLAAWNWPTALSLALLALTLWTARYWHSQQFGLYEDDLTLIPKAAKLSTPALLQEVGDYIIHLEGQARPLHHSLIKLGGHFGWRLADIWGPYLIGYAIEALNLWLFYALLRRITRDRRLALLGGFVYALYPADTTQAYLTHALGVQPSITLLLLALHSYLARRQPAGRIAAYILIAIILFSYETPFTVFLGAPLLAEMARQTEDLARPDIRRLVKTLGWHGLIIGGMLAGAYGLRALVGEEQVATQSLAALIKTALLHMLQGPAVSLALFPYRMLQTVQAIVQEGHWEALAVCGIGLVVFLGIFWPRQAINKQHQLEPARQGIATNVIVYLIVVGLALLTLAYPLTLTVRAYALTGRDTRVHLAGVVGAALVGTGAGAALLEAGRRRPRLQAASTTLLAGGLALLLGFGFVIQRDYVQAWRDEQTFWTAVIRLVPDVKAGTVILMTPEIFPDQDTKRQIQANTWNLRAAFNQLFDFPTEWETAPIVYRMRPGWEAYLASHHKNLRVTWQTSWVEPELINRFDSVRAIVIESQNGATVRREAPLRLNGEEFPIRVLEDPDQVPALPSYPPGFLFNYLITTP